MPITLIATPGHAAANSYVSLEEAQAYFATRLFATAWTGAVDDEVRKQALIMATNRLNTLPWEGTPSYPTQRLQWPRSGVYDQNDDSVAYDVIPEDVRIAVCEEAIDLLSKGSDPGAVDPLANFASMKVGPIAFSLKESAPRTTDQRRDAVWNLVGPYLQSSTAFDRG